MEKEVGKGAEFVNARQLSHYLGICEKTLFRWCKASLFPAPIRVGRRTLRWRVADVDKFLDTQEGSE
jgi:predicted DNA-binding transcriptional regulator AlpA